jgi:hypothetical protein
MTNSSPNDAAFSEIAAILAAGLQRLEGRLATENSPPDSSPACLEVSDETVLTVHTG